MAKASADAVTTAPPTEGRICHVNGIKGVVFPNRPMGDTGNNMKVLLYGFLLLYSFVGVSIVADMFMAAIERVTSKKKRIKVPGTSNRYITTGIWNETVANLTLMALGSSAPEILLAVNEIFKNDFHGGALGPSTIVGSAAFNLFVIIAVCINAIPSGETRQIKEEGVFFITAVFSVLAYVWLLFIVQINSPDIVSVSEGVVTFFFFPILVAISYASDAGLLRQWFYVIFRINTEEQKGVEAIKNGDPLSPRKPGEPGSPRNPMSPKSAGYTGKYSNKSGYDDEDEQEEEKEEVKASWCDTWCWLGILMCKCMACICGVFGVCCVKFLRKFRRKNAKKEDGEGEEDEEMLEAEINLEDPETQILDDDGEPIENEVGIISFKGDSMEVMGNEDEQQYTITVLRKNGTEGRISCKYRMEPFTATPGFDYVEEEGTVDFKNGVYKAEIEVTVLPKEIGEKADAFQIILEEPSGEAMFNPNSDGGDDQCLLTVTILNANATGGRMARLYGWVDGLINMDEMKQGSAAWYDQVVEAYYCNGSAEAQEEARFLDWVMHILCFPWKMLYALACPPPPYLGGKVCFVVALIHIGLLTAVIGDMAELFGCAAGIEDNITAISVVALGTSLPDLFASKQAATQDEYADASIVNVTGSNSVNVFLGIGLPWMAASIYWHIADGSKDALWMRKYGDTFLDRCPTGCFVVESGDLAFSVVVFLTGAMVCLVVIRVRRVVYDGELGGPAGSDSKACSSFLLVLLWVCYISLSVWKSVTKVDDWPTQIIAIAISVPVIVALMLFFGLMLLLLRITKEYIGEEGFFGIAVAVSIVVVRLVYFFMFQ